MSVEDLNTSNEHGLLTNQQGNCPELEVHVVSRLAQLKENWTSYFCSFDFIELITCSLFLVSGLVLEFADVEPRQRPIPYQQLESTGEYILSQIYNESSDGETVSSKSSDQNQNWKGILVSTN
jgi:hypothetical protein